MTNPYPISQARNVAKAAFRHMLRFGVYEGETHIYARKPGVIDVYSWQFDADNWRVIVTAPNGVKRTFNPAKSWPI